MEQLAREDGYPLEMGILRCFRGIDTAMALTLITEIFDIERFAHPRALMDYVGLVLRLYQSADPETRTGITRTGSRYARWPLGQVAMKYRHRPAVGLTLRGRRRGQPAWANE